MKENSSATRSSVRGMPRSSRSKMATSSTDRQRSRRVATTSVSGTAWWRFAPRASRRLLLRRLALQLDDALYLAIDGGASLGEELRVACDGRSHLEKIRNPGDSVDT